MTKFVDGSLLEISTLLDPATETTHFEETEENMDRKFIHLKF